MYVHPRQVIGHFQCSINTTNEMLSIFFGANFNANSTCFIVQVSQQCLIAQIPWLVLSHLTCMDLHFICCIPESTGVKMQPKKCNEIQRKPFTVKQLQGFVSALTLAWASQGSNVLLLQVEQSISENSEACEGHKVHSIEKCWFVSAWGKCNTFIPNFQNVSAGMARCISEISHHPPKSSQHSLRKDA